MIVPMKNVTLLALSKDENTALEILRDLGVMQIIPSEDISVESRTLSEDFSSALRTKQLLDNLRPEYADPAASGTASRGKAIIAEANTLFDRKSELETGISNLKQRLDRLKVWGDFNKGTLNELKEKGVEAILCSGTRDDFNKAETLENVTVFSIHETTNTVDFVAVMLGKDNAQTVAELPVFRLADDDDPITLAEHRSKLQQQLDDTVKRLSELSLESVSLQKYCNELGNAADYPGRAEKYDLVCANILGHLLIAFRFNIVSWVAPGGVLVLSGILDRDFDKVSAAFAEVGMTEIERFMDKDWKSGTFTAL